MTKTLEEILTKLEKDFSELKEYAVKLEAENCMLREELDKKDEDIPDNCAITLAQALNSAYVENNIIGFTTRKNKIKRYIQRNDITIWSYISIFNNTKFSDFPKYLTFETKVVFAIILIHYGINIKMDIENDKHATRKEKEIFAEIFKKYSEEIKFKPIKS